MCWGGGLGLMPPVNFYKLCKISHSGMISVTQQAPHSQPPTENDCGHAGDYMM